MITTYAAEKDRLRPADDEVLNAPNVVWIDLFNPTPEEESAVSKALGVNVPSREDMQEIEQSSRLYLEDHAAFSSDFCKAPASGTRPQRRWVSSRRLLE
jgi:magnesium transporter